MTDDALFPDVARTDGTPAKANESRYHFLSRSASKYPDIAGATTRPDFLIDDGRDRFYLEAVSVGKPSATIAEDRRLRDVHRVLTDLQVNNFSVGMEHFSIGPRSLGTRRLRTALQRWLQGLDAETVASKVSSEAEPRLEHLPQMVWEDEGWSLVFQAFPLKASARGALRNALGMMGPGEAAIVDNVSGIRRVLEAKYGRYGPLDAPLVIAVQSNTDIPTHDYQVERTLFGLTARRPTDPKVLDDNFAEDGFWLTSNGWRRSDCPQVITVHGLAPWTVGKSEPRLWTTLEPGVAGPAKPGWLRQIVIGEDAVPTPGLDLGTFFGLETDILERIPDFDLS